MPLCTSLLGLKSSITIQRVYLLMVIHALTDIFPIHTRANGYHDQYRGSDYPLPPRYPPVAPPQQTLLQCQGDVSTP